MRAAETLTEDERILRADGDDEGCGRAEAGEERCEHGVDAMGGSPFSTAQVS
jgi:hypothetical protein